MGKLFGKVERNLYIALSRREKLNTLKSSYQKIYGINARQFNSIYASIKGKISSCSDKEGNLKARGQIKINLRDRSSHKVRATLGESVAHIVKLANLYQCPITVEKLDFSGKRASMRESGVRYSRMLSNFAYSQFLSMLESRASRWGIELIKVNPAYSSLIGVRFVLEKPRNGGNPDSNKVIFSRLSSHLNPLLDDNLSTLWVRNNFKSHPTDAVVKALSPGLRLAINARSGIKRR